MELGDRSVKLGPKREAAQRAKPGSAKHHTWATTGGGLEHPPFTQGEQPKVFAPQRGEICLKTGQHFHDN